jgi:recombination DNA repair RAD52 pathway protein
MNLTREQYDVLLKPLAAHRVSQRQQAGMTLSYLEAWDVKAHLIRVFGFCGWSADVISSELAFEDKDEKGRWNVGYKVLMRLRVHDFSENLYGGDVTYTEAAVGSATNGSRGDAHDMAIKTAESDALKRAAINLGTQFGLSLYDSGNRQDVVGHTLKPPAVDMSPEAIAAEPEPEIDKEMIDHLLEVIDLATSEESLKTVWEELVTIGVLDYDLPGGDTPRSIIVDKLADIRQGAQ